MKRLWMSGVLLVIGAAVLVWCGKQDCVQACSKEQPIKVIAHRAGALDAPENTLAAVDHAVQVGADMVEIDLRMTKDGVPVALHDETLLRTAGLDRAVCEMSIREVKELDAGEWFSPDFADERIPTLKELLEVAKGRIRVMLELKAAPNSEDLLEQTIQEIRSAGMEAECVLAAENLEFLRRGAELAPELETVYIGQTADSSLWDLSYVDGYSISILGLSKADVEKAHEVGRELYAWTVNAPWEMSMAVEMGVDGLVTDAPETAKQYRVF